jgi:hypothetical protein
MSLGLLLPDPPLPPELAWGLRKFMRETFFHPDIRVAGFSPRQFQQSIRHSAAACGLPLRALLPKEIAYGDPNGPDLGPYHPEAGMRARMR